MAKEIEQMSPSEKAAHTAKWAIIEAKWAIRRALLGKHFPKWKFVTFEGESGQEARGIVDMIAIRKDHGEPPNGLKRGDLLQIVLIQAKGGSAADPTEDDAKRLRKVARLHNACEVLLFTWKKGRKARFFSLTEKPNDGASDWEAVDPSDIFRKRETQSHATASTSSRTKRSRMEAGGAESK